MQLDFNERNDTFILWVPRGEADVRELQIEYGLDYSQPASTVARACLFTNTPYAAATFAQYATPAAKLRLAGIMRDIEASRALGSGRHFEVPYDKELWAFQNGSVEYALDRPNCLIADDPGLGKTEEAIVIANEMHATRVGVICPASIRWMWRERILEWSTMPRWAHRQPRCQVLTSSRYGAGRGIDWTIVSWDLVWRHGLHDALLMEEYDLLILDEAHYAKTIDANRTRAVFGGGRPPVSPLAGRAKRTIALTGTPLPNRPREAFVLARHLHWEAIDYLGERAFNERFNPRNVNKDGGVWVDERVGRAAELQNRLRANFMVRHLKRDVMTQLHYPLYDIIRVEETSAVKAALKAEKLLDIDPETLTGADAAILGDVATARRLMGVAMAPQVADYVADLLDGGEYKLVLFAWHIQVLDILCERLSNYGVVRVDGSDSGPSKHRKVRQFIEDPALRVVIGNHLSLGTGTDGLQHVADHVLIAEPDWTHGVNQQCIDRLDRGGQTRQVRADLFAAPGSISERVLAAALRKGQVVDRALDRQFG